MDDKYYKGYTNKEFELLDKLSKAASARIKGNITDGYSYCLNDVTVTRKLHENYDFSIRKVIFNGPATIVYWADGEKTVVKCQENDIFDPEKGLAMAISKKALGNKSSFNNTFKKWLPQPEELELDIRCIHQTDDNREAFENIKKAFSKLF